MIMMMMEDNKFKLRISRIFNGSCKSRDDVAPYHDVLEKSPLLSRPPPLPRPSICNPRTLHINYTCIVHPTRSKSTVAAFSHFANNPFYDHGGSQYSAVKDYRGKKKKKIKISDDHDFFSSDDEREDDDYNEERTVNTSENRRHWTRNRGSPGRATGVRGSMAVVKKSMDPYGDFGRSMMEMIIERQIFGEKELEQLLICFLSLNSIHLHDIIVQVFNEILDALFSM